MEKRLIAIFDIDKTIISRDSMFSLIRYAFKKYPQTRYETMKFLGYGVKYAFKQIDTKTVKQAAFSCINHLTKDDLEKYYREYLSKYIYIDALNKMKELKKQGYIILLVTASPECYMRHFESIDEVDYVIGTRLVEKNGRFLNEILGENCKGEEKVKRINSWLEEKNIAIDYENSWAFSDSMSDLPMFELVKNSYIINNRYAKYMNKLYWK